jgi:hypothetical protein
LNLFSKVIEVLRDKLGLFPCLISLGLHCLDLFSKFLSFRDLFKEGRVDFPQSHGKRTGGVHVTQTLQLT